MQWARIVKKTWATFCYEALMLCCLSRGESRKARKKRGCAQREWIEEAKLAEEEESMATDKFQVLLCGKWESYDDEEDKILKMAFMSGLRNAKIEVRGWHYYYDFIKMKQINEDTKRTRDIRPPKNWKAPSAPLVPVGRTTAVLVRKGSAGTTMSLAHPEDNKRTISVQVPPESQAGQVMLVPVPDVKDCPASGEDCGSGEGAEVVIGAPLGHAVGAARSSKKNAAVCLGGAAAVAAGALLAVDDEFDEYLEMADMYISDSCDFLGEFLMTLF